MKILLVSSYLPYPLFDGGRIRLYNLLKFLKDKHEITLVCEKRDNQTEQDVDEVRKVCTQVITVRRKKQWSLGNIIKTSATLDPFLITGHRSLKMKRVIEKLLNEEKFDLIHVETFYVMQNLPKTTLPVILAEHNIEYLVYQRYADRAPILLKPFLAVDIAKIKRIEKNFWKKADRLIAVSPKEQALMGEGTLLIPNGVDTQKFKIKKVLKNKKNKKVLFIGDFKWLQNRDSLAYILKNIWPSIISKNKGELDLKLWIVGKHIPDSVKQLQDATVLVDENATNETEQIFQEADLLLSPIRVGGGTNFKILESMASGTPVLTTSLGNEGLGAQNESEIMVCSKPEEFANKAFNLLTDDYLYEKLSRNGRKFVEENFDWRSISKKLDNVYLSVQRE